MTKKKHAARVALRQASDALADEIWLGKWDHIKNLDQKRISELTELLAKLALRCPGHTPNAYADALTRSLFLRR